MTYWENKLSKLIYNFICLCLYFFYATRLAHVLDVFMIGGIGSRPINLICIN